MSADVLVVGGTGHLGKDLVAYLASASASIRVASRRARPLGTNLQTGSQGSVEWAEMDLVSGRGVQEAVLGAHTIIFAAGDPKQHVAVEVDGMRGLLAAAKKAGVAHFVYVSIVGIEQLPVPYYRTKVAAERLIRESGVPYTILRATQFHYFVAMLFSGLARLPFVLPVPMNFKVQPVATQDVAMRLVRSVTTGPAGLAKDFCGPEVLSVSEAAALWKAARGVRRRIISVPIPGKLGAAFRIGWNTNPKGEFGSLRFSDWLAGGAGAWRVPVSRQGQSWASPTH